MIGYLAYCKRVESKTDCKTLVPTEPSETEETETFEAENFPQTARLFWADLKILLSKGLDTTDFTRTIK